MHQNIKIFYKRVIKFLISGGSAAAVEYVVFICLHALLNGKLLIVCQSFSFLCGFVVSFTLNRKWVFRSNGNSKQELIRYAILASINLILSNVMIWLLVDVIQIVFWLSKFIVMAAISTWNYVIYQKFIFINKI